MNNPAVADEGVYRVDVHEIHGVCVIFKRFFIRSTVKVGIEGEVMLGQTAVGDSLNDHGTDAGFVGFVGLDHVVQQIIKNVPCVYCDLVQLRYDTIDAKRLVSLLGRFHDFSGRLREGVIRPNVG